MSRPASVVRHDDIVRAQKALRKTGASIGKLIILPDRVEIVPSYGEIGEEQTEIVDETAARKKPLREPVE